MSIKILERTYQSIGDEYLEEARECVDRGKYVFAIQHYAQAIRCYLQNVLPAINNDTGEPTASDLWKVLACCQVSDTSQSLLSIPMLTEDNANALQLLDIADKCLRAPIEGYVPAALDELDDGYLLARVADLAMVAQAACYCATVYNNFLACYTETAVNEEAPEESYEGDEGEEYFEDVSSQDEEQEANQESSVEDTADLDTIGIVETTDGASSDNDTPVAAAHSVEQREEVEHLRDQFLSEPSVGIWHGLTTEE